MGNFNTFPRQATWSIYFKVRSSWIVLKQLPWADTTRSSPLVSRSPWSSDLSSPSSSPVAAAHTWWISIFNFDFSPEIQSSLSSCLLDTVPWMFWWHLKLVITSETSLPSPLSTKLFFLRSCLRGCTLSIPKTVSPDKPPTARPAPVSAVGHHAALLWDARSSYRGCSHFQMLIQWMFTMGSLHSGYAF